MCLYRFRGTWLGALRPLDNKPYGTAIIGNLANGPPFIYILSGLITPLMSDKKQPLRATRKRRTRPKTGLTVADVARVASVSPMTVSRVVNGELMVRQHMQILARGYLCRSSN